MKLSRRSFLSTTALGSLSVPLSTSAAKPAALAKFSVRPFELDELSVSDLGRGLASGKWRSSTLVKAYLEKIEKVDRSGPHLRSVIELNPDALAIARERDRERRAGAVRGPLHGIPVLLKDNLGTHDRMSTTAGSLALEGSTPAQDSHVAMLLRRAGAVILGKTNLSEWANFRSNRSTSGWSGRGGQTRNPYVLNRNPSGSSSGSGAAVSASLCGAAIGTETDGSIVSPSSACGIVGLKPTVGLVSRAGIIPISSTQDTAGPMTRSVRDAALMLNAIAGEDPRDGRTASNRGHIPPDYTAFLARDGLRGARIGVLRRLFSTRREVIAAMEASLSVLKSEGAVLVDPADWPEKVGTEGGEFQVLLYEFKDGLNAYFASLGPNARVKSLEDLIRFNEDHADRELPFFGQETAIEAQKKGGLQEAEYLEALKKCRRFTENSIDAVVREHRLDALIAPTFGAAHATDHIYGDRGVPGSSTAAAVAGYPSITLPAAFHGSLPIGISFFSTAWQEPAILRLAYAFEQATRVRKPPAYLPELA